VDDGFAAGIGNNKAVVILEPDGLGIIPWYNPFANRDTWVTNPNYEWCQPAEADPATAAADRFAMLNYAVDKLKENPGTSVYLDGTHSGWLGAGDAPTVYIRPVSLMRTATSERVQLPPELAPGEVRHLIAKCIWFGDPVLALGALVISNGARVSILLRTQMISPPGTSPTNGMQTTLRVRPGFPIRATLG
jgi:hypothetical protein